MKFFLILAVIFHLFIVNFGFQPNAYIRKFLFKPTKTIHTTKSMDHYRGHRQSSSLFTSRCDSYSDLVKKPRWGGPLGVIIRYLNQLLFGVVFSIILRVLNRFRAHNLKELLSLIWKRPNSRGLLTVSNHQSVIDDPGLFSAFVPWWILPINKFRWTICTEDVFFANSILQKMLGAGNGLPLDRSGSLEQPMFQRFQEKLDQGNWCHIFPEGRVWQTWRFEDSEVHLGKFKFGVGKIIAHCKNEPIILPIFHKGMDKVIPEKVLNDKKSKKPSKPISLVPKVGNLVQLYVGRPIDFSKKIADFRLKYPGIIYFLSFFPALYSK